MSEHRGPDRGNVCWNKAHYPQLDLPAEYDARLHNYDTGTPCEYYAMTEQASAVPASPLHSEPRFYETSPYTGLVPYYDQDGITIYNADCLDVLPFLDPVDHVITDPPYSRDLYLRFRTNKGARGSDRGYATPNHLALSNEQIGAVDDVYEAVAPELMRLARRWIVVFHDAESGHLWRESFGEQYIRAGVWVKINPVPQISGDRPAQGFESMTIAHGPGRKRWNGGGQPAVWRYASVNGKSADRPDHPCPKPRPLMRKLIGQFTDAGETILDPFMGSGTTLRAAKDLGRKAIGIEISEEYCRVAVERLRQAVLL